MNFSEAGIQWDKIYAELTLDMPGIAVYALLDGAQVYHSAFFKTHDHRRKNFISVLNDDAEPDAELAGPILIALEEYCSADFPNQLIALLREKNAVSFLSSQMNIRDLKTHLTWLTDVTHDDGTKWVMRYFDPRIFPNWAEILSPIQRSYALSPISRWLYMAADGSAQLIVGGDEISPRPHTNIFLTLAQQDFLISRSLPYLILSSIEEDDPSLLYGMSYVQKASSVAKSVMSAVRNGLQSFVDIKTFCVIAEEAVEQFIDVPEVQKALSDGPNGRFHEHVLQWDDEVWNALRTPR
jgi:hypothetical protein